MCEMCEYEYATSFHHLIPRALHSNKWFKKRFTREQMRQGIEVCSGCHQTIHRFIPEKQLGRHFYTFELLKSHEEIAKYIQWRRSKARLAENDQ